MAINALKHTLDGELLDDDTTRTLYATDASAYRELPQAVAFPKHAGDIQQLIRYARKVKTALIPRTAGTSLAGQVVGSGIVVDVSKHFTQILEVNAKEKWVRVQPGVVRDELNLVLSKQGLFFGPETSTANRAMLGGMVGNNSSGANSLVYGSTRESLLELKGFLSDGSPVHFKHLSKEAFAQKCRQADSELETKIYQQINTLLSEPAVRTKLKQSYPKASIKRRNTGYALDLLAKSEVFEHDGPAFNFCQLIAGSEGTLMFITEIKLKCHPLPPKHKGLLCVHCHSIDEALQANLVALNHKPSACELMDAYILDRTKNNLEQRKNRFFIAGEPAAVLVVELAEHSQASLQAAAQALKKDLQEANFGYHYPLVTDNNIKRVWTLRKAGLGLLSNIPGDAKPVPVIEDTAVDVHDLPAYIRAFNAITAQYGVHCVHYAHAGAGELHLRPVINLKTTDGNRLFRAMANEIAQLVKKYQGSLSGEHGDGRLRGEYIQFMLGTTVYNWLKTLKHTWDPERIFNPGKIIDSPPMDKGLRFMPDTPTPEIATVFDFSTTQGYLRTAEFCNGSGDCRKSHLMGGTMCPSYRATRDEKQTTRARANMLREYLRKPANKNHFNHPELFDVLSLCLACKACKAECPSNVDMAKLKAEFLQHYQDANGISLRTWVIANMHKINKVAAWWPAAYNFLATNAIFSSTIKSVLGFAQQRSLPTLQPLSLAQWIKKHQPVAEYPNGTVYLFNDEFTNFQDAEIGVKAILLFEALGYRVLVPPHKESARTYLSKGMLRKAKAIAQQNISLLKELISSNTPLVGIEPSALLSFRDEYPDLLRGQAQLEAKALAKNCLMWDEFLAQEINKGNIKQAQFTQHSAKIMLHGHCHQKALASTEASAQVLSFPAHYEVEVMKTGCCGMAGSFGFEKEHYAVSIQVAELVLLPAVRRATSDTLIAAPGTSCRHQLTDGTDKMAYHPIELLYDALNKNR